MLDSVKERIAKYGIIADPLRFIRRTDRGKPNGVASLDNDGKILVEQLPDAALEETDPTVPQWAKEPEPPLYTAEDVGADSFGTAERLIGIHNSDSNTHNDIRVLISEIREDLNSFLDIDDNTTAKLSELLRLISEAEETTDINALTINKVNITDIIDSLDTKMSDKPLSAKQGSVLKEYIDVIALDYVKNSQIRALEDRISAIEDAVGGLIFRSRTTVPIEATDNTITFVDLNGG